MIELENELGKTEINTVRLSVNINKIATLRNSRGGNNPNLVQVAKDCIEFGAEGITIHPRPDERHIRKQDVFDLKPVITQEFNIEGYPSKDFLELIKKIKPEQVTLVPDTANVLTSNNGWDCKKHHNFLQDIVGQISEFGSRVSLFLNPDPEQVTFAKSTMAQCIELYTESYAKNYYKDKAQGIEPYKRTSELAHSLGLIINAGHDLDLNNLSYFVQEIEHLKEVSIGHALVCDALYYGIHNTIILYKNAIKKGQKTDPNL